MLLTPVFFLIIRPITGRFVIPEYELAEQPTEADEPGDGHLRKDGDRAVPTQAGRQ